MQVLLATYLLIFVNQALRRTEIAGSVRYVRWVCIRPCIGCVRCVSDSVLGCGLLMLVGEVCAMAKCDLGVLRSVRLWPEQL